MIIYDLAHKAAELNYQDGKYIYKTQPNGYIGLRIWYDLANNKFSESYSYPWKRHGKNIGINVIEWGPQKRTLLINRKGYVYEFDPQVTMGYVPDYALADDELTFAVLEAGGKRVFVFDLE